MTTPSQVALVTGANRGIGLEVVRQLARRGMHVILGARQLEKGERAARVLTQEGLSVLPRQLDVTDQQSIDRLMAEVTTKFGRLDVLVNNAAYCIAGLLLISVISCQYRQNAHGQLKRCILE